jgi:hypothetical protein
MLKFLGFSLLAVAAVAAFVVFGVWQPFAGWDYAEVLAKEQAELGKDREVLAVEIDHGTVAFVLKEGKDRVRVRHYSRHCVLHDGDATVNGSEVKGACELRTRRQATFTRPATDADRGPSVPLGKLTADVIDRLEAAGMRSLDDPVFWRGRWRFDAPLTVSRSAAPDGSDIRREETMTGMASLAVREMVGAPPIDNPQRAGVTKATS